MTIRTVEEALAAGIRAAQNDPPLTLGQVTAVALLLAPYREHQNAERGAAPAHDTRIPDVRE